MFLNVVLQQHSQHILNCFISLNSTKHSSCHLWVPSHHGSQSRFSIPHTVSSVHISFLLWKSLSPPTGTHISPKQLIEIRFILPLFPLSHSFHCFLQEAPLQDIKRGFSLLFSSDYQLISLVQCKPLGQSFILSWLLWIPWNTEGSNDTCSELPEGIFPPFYLKRWRCQIKEIWKVIGLLSVTAKAMFTGINLFKNVHR